MKTNADKLFKTTDLSQSAFLLISGFPYVTTQKNQAGRTFFVFKDSPELQRAIMDYISDTAKVSPRAYYYCWRDLRSKI